MEIIGRLTADAKVNELKDGRQVVNFSIAMNDSYKLKDSNEIKRVATYFNCSYWISSNIAKVLTKGTLVELYGRVAVSTYTNSQGEVKAALSFHVNSIKLHGKSSTEKVDTAAAVAVEENAEPGDDLPF